FGHASGDRCIGSSRRTRRAGVADGRDLGRRPDPRVGRGRGHGRRRLGVGAVDRPRDAAGCKHVTASSLTVVLPAFNEEARLGVARAELFGYLRRRGAAGRDGAPGPQMLPPAIDVLIVDDGSTDRTAQIVRERPEFGDEGTPRLGLLQVEHGGKGAAVRAGMLAATGEVVVFADADMATPPDQLPLLVLALNDADVALGSRIQPDGRDMRRSQPVYRRLLGRGFHLLASAWVNGPVRDTQCGFKGFRGPVARDLFARQRIRSIVFDVELI